MKGFANIGRRHIIAGLGLLLAMAAAQAAPRKVVRIAMSESAIPHSYIEQGQVAGIYRELLDVLFGLLPQYQAEYHSYPWIRAQRLVEFGDMDMFLTFPSTSRKRYASFAAKPVYELDYGNLVFDKSGKAAPRLEAAKSFKDLEKFIFVNQEAVDWEVENIPAYLPRYTVNGPSGLMHMTFSRAKGDYFLMTAEQATYFARQYGYLEHLGMKKVGFIPNSLVPMHIGVRKSLGDQGALLRALESAMQHPSYLARHAAIVAKYRGQIPGAIQPCAGADAARQDLQCPTPR
jgi:hypothetical protein